MAVSGGSCRGGLATPSHVHPYPHSPPANVATSEHQSTARILVPSGPFGIAEQGLLFEHFFLIQNFRTGWVRGNACNLLDFDNQSAAIICLDTVKYNSIPSVPRGVEEVKTRRCTSLHLLQLGLAYFWHNRTYSVDKWLNLYLTTKNKGPFSKLLLFIAISPDSCWLLNFFALGARYAVR